MESPVPTTLGFNPCSGGCSSEGFFHALHPADDLGVSILVLVDVPRKGSFVGVLQKMCLVSILVLVDVPRKVPAL